MADQPDFTKLVPGFDFLQKLVGGANAAMPAMGQWVAPTLNPEELEKRISELRTVQFWLEQNARMLGATIQALEVQRMTLTTLKTMNVQMGDLREALKIRLPDPPAPAPAPAARAAA
uniref:PhaM family polyhydroxyalkanoate granule multifunctional regulatory protein n=1 Tax=Azohydromonas aeria TaxID=2590212 RepID=UPI0035C0659E